MEFSGKKSIKDYPEKEKTAYLAAVASMATANDKASAEEEEFLKNLCEEVGISSQSCEEVVREAKSPGNDGFENYIDWMRDSDLKFSFIVDTLSFAHADGEYTQEEKLRIQKMSDRLGITIQQYEALNDYVNKAQKAEGEEATDEDFLSKTGLKEKFENLNIPVKGLLTGLVGSMLMRGMMGGGYRRRGLLGSMMGGGYRRGGGLTSLMGMLSGHRGYRRSGGLLGRLL